MSPKDRFQICGQVSGLIETASTKAEAFRIGAALTSRWSEMIEVFDCFAHRNRPECWRYDSGHWIEMSKRIGTPVKAVPAPLTFTTDEVFIWVCQKQGIKRPEYLQDGRYMTLWRIAEKATQQLNELFAAVAVEA